MQFLLNNWSKGNIYCIMVGLKCPNTQGYLYVNRGCAFFEQMSENESSEKVASPQSIYVPWYQNVFLRLHPQNCICMKINTAEKEGEGRKAVKNECEKKERMLERAVVRSSWFWFNKNLKQQRLRTLILSIFTVSCG